MIITLYSNAVYLYTYVCKCAFPYIYIYIYTIDIQTNRPTNQQTHKVNKLTNKQTYKQTNKQTYKQTNKHYKNKYILSYLHTYIHTPITTICVHVHTYIHVCTIQPTKKTSGTRRETPQSQDAREALLSSVRTWLRVAAQACHQRPRRNIVLQALGPTVPFATPSNIMIIPSCI